jgi:hypothetical protein
LLTFAVKNPHKTYGFALPQKKNAAEQVSGIQSATG